MTAAWQFWQTPEGEAEAAESTDYSEWTKAALAAELAKRDLPKSGTKAELVARLEEDDG